MADAIVQPTELVFVSARNHRVIPARIQDMTLYRSCPLIFGALVLLTAACGANRGTPTSENPSQEIIPRPFLETFNGAPMSPTPFQPASWDLSRHATHSFGFAPMQGMHGPDCSAPPATHSVDRLDDAVFQCKDHVMTAIYTHGYGEVVLTPNRMVDFSTEEAVVAFDVSTLRTAGRDWIDVWITPFDEHLQLPVDNDTPDLSDAPRRAVQIEMPAIYGVEGLNPAWTFFTGRVYSMFQPTEIPQATTTPYADLLTPSAITRSRFELHISRTHVKFGMPAYNLWWIDSPIADIGWTQGIVQFAHHSYHPVEDSDCLSCTPDTWHWDNVEISRAVPFTIISAEQRQLPQADGGAVATFPRPAPADAFLRFTAVAGTLDVSFDGGVSWLPARTKSPQQLKSRGFFWSYWTPVPVGTTSVRFRGTPHDGNDWVVRDISIWSRIAS